MTKKTINQSNPFVFEQKGQTNGVRKLDYTPALIGKSNARATELMGIVGKNPELHELANTALDRGETQDVINLIEAVFDEETIKADAQILDGADEEQLGRLLESRRSDRSKAKSKGPRLNVGVCQTFIGSMYAEMLVRLVWNKPFQQTTTEIDYDDLKEDQDALNRKIRSLQSKQSRLRKTAEFVEADKKELEEVMTEIDRLKSLRTTTGKISTKTVIRDADAETLREALKLVKIDGLDAEQQEKIQRLMDQLG